MSGAGADGAVEKGSGLGNVKVQWEGILVFHVLSLWMIVFFCKGGFVLKAPNQDKSHPEIRSADQYDLSFVFSVFFTKHQELLETTQFLFAFLVMLW